MKIVEIPSSGKVLHRAERNYPESLKSVHGDEVVLSIGACPGIFGGMSSPFVVNLSKKRISPKDPWNVRTYVPYWLEVIEKTCAD